MFIKALVVFATLFAACSAILPIQLPEDHAIHAYHASQSGAGMLGQSYYFPCDAVSAKSMAGADLGRLYGSWFTTNVAMALSDKMDTDQFQRQVSATMSCTNNTLNITGMKSLQWSQLLNLRQPLPPGVLVPGAQIVNNRTGILRVINAILPVPGDNGRWLLTEDMGDAMFNLDLYVVATDYTNFFEWYTCADIPVPGTADTKREQQWGIERRSGQNFNDVELAVLKIVALRAGVVDMDRLYELATDGC